MDSLPSMLEFVLAVSAAFVGGAILRKLRQPPVVGYLLAGVVIGPALLGVVSDTDRIKTLADFGVAFLMFQAGTELSLSQLKKMQGIALIGPWVQLLLFAPLVVAAAVWLSWPYTTVSYLGLIIALSSTTVVVKLMNERGEMDSQHGRAAIAFSIVQDLPMIPAIVIFTALATATGATSTEMVGTIGISLGKAVLFVVVAYVVGVKLVPIALRRIESMGSEVLLLAVISLALGMAYISNLMGMSLVLGAFIAGLVVAESEVHFKVLKEVSPISDLFVTFFFVSVGMLLDFRFVLTHIPQVLIIVGIIMIAKTFVMLIVGLVFKYPGRSALLMALAMAQIGEEAFLLAQVGLDKKVLSPDMYSLVLSGAVLSIVLSPLGLNAAPFLIRVFQRVPLLGHLFIDAPGMHSVSHKALTNHVIICGYGNVGRELATTLDRRGIRYLVIETEPHYVSMLREKGIPCIMGDASKVQVLNQSGVQQAQSMAVTFPNPIVTEAVVRCARRVRKGMPIFVRGTGDEEMVELLYAAGATEVVNPSFEASMEFISKVLRGTGTSSKEVEKVVLTRRIGFYS
ncbi:MAG: hypothetical protein EXR67_02905 [Dehalococcoidia bacterium]|nr:hypothetical protein [Dehalococcoidia bacterium]